jgi:hypothetical protein
MAGENARTLGDVLSYLGGPKCTWDTLALWPPDVFAVTGVIISQSGAFRLAVSPDGDHGWPPLADDPSSSATTMDRWQSHVGQIARAWAERAVDPNPVGQVPKRIRELIGIVKAASETPVHDVSNNWELACALLQLHVIADETATDFFGSTADYQQTLGFALDHEQTVSRLPVDRVRVMPKLRTPTGGITVRSLSRNLAFLNADMETTWVRMPGREVDPRLSRVLVIPWPPLIQPTDFKDMTGEINPLTNMDGDAFGFFSFQPRAQIDYSAVLHLVQRAIDAAGGVDVVVFPEAALTKEDTEAIEQGLLNMGVSLLLLGVRETPPASLGKNYVQVSIAVYSTEETGERWRHYQQHKYHRWCLDRDQIQQYHLGPRLHPERRWWEAIELPARSRIFIRGEGELTICPVICEDLARLDAGGDSVHAVGPTLVVALLLDGPQLDSRWPARYASVLADDPGSSVLSVTSLGMALRSRPARTESSRTIALWKDRQRGVREITLEEGRDAVLLTLCAERVESVTADGRRDGKRTEELLLAGVEQIACAKTINLVRQGADTDVKEDTAFEVPPREPESDVSELPGSGV